MNLTPGSVWRHYKRTEKFIILCVARLESSSLMPSAEGAAFVIHHAYGASEKVFARPIQEWLESVTVAGDRQPRFTRIANSIDGLFHD